MNKQIMLAIIIVSLISCASAIDIIAGDTWTKDLGEVPAYYEITGNTSNVDVTYDGTIALITPNKYMKNNTFTIIFYNEKDEQIEQGGSSSGNSGRGCSTIWVCGDWSECDGTQTRECVKEKTYCGTKEDKPIEIKDCEVPPEPIIKEEVKDSKNKTYWIIIIVAGIGLLLIIWVLISKG